MKSPVKGLGESLAGSKKKSEKRAPAGLLRPVICICNDLHAPALRPLRAVAELVEFKAASNAQLLARLKTVRHRRDSNAIASAAPRASLIGCQRSNATHQLLLAPPLSLPMLDWPP